MGFIQACIAIQSRSTLLWGFSLLTNKGFLPPWRTSSPPERHVQQMSHPFAFLVCLVFLSGTASPLSTSFSGAPIACHVLHCLVSQATPYQVREDVAHETNHYSGLKTRTTNSNKSRGSTSTQLLSSCVVFLSSSITLFSLLFLYIWYYK